MRPRERHWKRKRKFPADEKQMKMQMGPRRLVEPQSGARNSGQSCSDCRGCTSSLPNSNQATEKTVDKLSPGQWHRDGSLVVRGLDEDEQQGKHNYRPAGRIQDNKLEKNSTRVDATSCDFCDRVRGASLGLCRGQGSRGVFACQMQNGSASGRSAGPEPARGDTLVGGRENDPHGGNLTATSLDLRPLRVRPQLRHRPICDHCVQQPAKSAKARDWLTDAPAGLNKHRRAPQRKRHTPPMYIVTSILLCQMQLVAQGAGPPSTQPTSAAGQLSSSHLQQQWSDPRPTIYSGDVSFALLLSAHSTLGGGGAELTTSASHWHVRWTDADLAEEGGSGMTTAPSSHATATTRMQTDSTLRSSGPTITSTGAPLLIDPIAPPSMIDGNATRGSHAAATGAPTSAEPDHGATGRTERSLTKRQIFERNAGNHYRQRQAVVRRQQQQAANKTPAGAPSMSHSSPDYHGAAGAGTCSQVNPSALYAGMGAIWASHQANLVGDSQLTIGTYIYDSCNELDVGQRQSVRIVANLNAFQQTTCQLPRGAPISLTIAHGDNQLRAIQLLTSFRVPVITTKEHFALEDYQQLNRDQRRFLFSTAPSSRHLALGALRFARRVVNRSSSSPKLPNQFHKLSSKNGLVVISRNLPARFLAYLSETIPSQVNYEMLQTSQPIDQVRSIESLESILGRTPSVSGASESGPEPVLIGPTDWPASVGQAAGRHTRQAADADSASDLAELSNDEPANQEHQGRMLSPTILMFITPAEAIDLVTRLRNDLAEVSKYYSLIVSTREDISPALRTIFHRGGSRLCSGKAFYTISPLSDDIGEFSRYFRDTVQMDGESSDHPLITEFAKHQATSRLSADLDDVGTEPVIKAVWTAAAAFKSVHGRECGPSSVNSHQSSSSSPMGSTGTRSVDKLHGRQAATASKSDCMVKMSKNMSNLVQRALRSLDVRINSTGLQALDGFRIKFDASNELMTNKFSIKYVNKECEILEIGQYSGSRDSALDLDEDMLLKSLEGTLPDPWPVQTTQTPVLQNAADNSLASLSPSTSSSSSAPASASSAGADDVTSNQLEAGPIATPASFQTTNGAEEGQSSSAPSGDEDGSGEASSGANENDSKYPAGSFEAAQASEQRKKRRPSLKLDSQLEARVNRQSLSNRLKKQVKLNPEDERLASGMPTMSIKQQDVTTITSTIPGLAHRGRLQSMTTTQKQVPTTTTTRPMRKLKPFPTGAATTLHDWLPRSGDTPGPKAPGGSVGTTNESSGRQTTLSSLGNMPAASGRQTDSSSATSDLDQELATASTTRAPSYSTLPESGGNTDLDLPAFKAVKNPSGTTKVMDNQQSSLAPAGSLDVTTFATTRQASHRSLDNSEVSSESTDYVTLAPFRDQKSTMSSTPLGSLTTVEARGSPDQVMLIADGPTNHSLSQIHQQAGDDEHHNLRLQELRDLNTSPIPLSSLSGQGGHKPVRLSSSLLESTDNNGLKTSATNGPNATRPSSALPAYHGINRQTNNSKFRSQLKWIYSSWFALTILGANIGGALFTLYVLTFLLIKNCNGTLDRENQGMRSMHLLAIIVVFFGSTLFIVYPTPGLCLLRTSWHNFALVLLFGSLLLQTMQIRSMSSLGLGGRPNRLNQFLTLMFMVGAQVSFELQRWRYESPNYINFVNQYFGASELGDKRLLLFSTTMAAGHMMNPLNLFNDQLSPVSLQVSEKYQGLLQEYCSQTADSFLQSQVYIWIIIGLLVLFSLMTRRQGRALGGAVARARAHTMVSSAKHHPKLQATLMAGGKLLVASEQAHPRGLQDSQGLANHHSQYEFSPNVIVDGADATGGSGLILGGAAGTSGGLVASSAGTTIGNVLLVTLINVPIYLASVVMHVHGSSPTSQDLVSSISMVLIAFTTLLGIFLPIIHRVQHRFDGLLSASSSSSSSSPSERPAGRSTLARLAHATLSRSAGNRLQNGNTLVKRPRPGSGGSSSSVAGAFAMFPEFAPTGLRRPASLSGESSSGAGSRRPFSETRESRKNMSLALANLGPSIGSLRNLGLGHRSKPTQLMATTDQLDSQPIDPALLNLKLNLNADDELAPIVDHDLYNHQHHQPHDHHHLDSPQHQHQHHQNHNQIASRPASREGPSSPGEKRLIMLDVDPCCPRHGLGVTGSASNWPQAHSTQPNSRQQHTMSDHGHNLPAKRHSHHLHHHHHHHQDSSQSQSHHL